MSPHEPMPHEHPRSRADTVLAEAVAALRTHEDPRWVEVSPRILNAALRARRRSHPVRAQAPGGPVAVSEQVVVAYLRHAIDGRIPGTAVAAIHVDITGRDTFTGVLIELIVQYGVPILPVADRARVLASAVLADLLGPAATAVDVRTSHVHVSDVSAGDPQVTDPGG